MAAQAAAQGIREVGDHAPIGMISQEQNPPYDRPPLSKGLWKGADEENIWRDVAGLDVDLYLNRRVEALDLSQSSVRDDQGEVFHYQNLLLATGGSPRSLSRGNQRVLPFRTYEDYLTLKDWVERYDHFAVVGGGFIGAELAAALRLQDKEVTMIFPEGGIGGGRFPEDLAQYLVGYYRDHGVKVRVGESVKQYEMRGEHLLLHTSTGEEIPVEAVVEGLGIVPNTELVEGTGIVLDDGIVVDSNLRTSQPRIYAAGDVASFYSDALERRLRVEHEDNALTMGRMAGRAMAGAQVNYDYLPMFYSDLFDMGYEAVGILDGELQTTAVWEDAYRKGVVYYLEENRIRGVLLWNSWDKLDSARELLRSRQPFQVEDIQEMPIDDLAIRI